MAERPGRGAGCARGHSAAPGEEQHCRARLLRSQPSPGHRSSSSPIRTEGFAARLREGVVEPAGDVPREGARPGRDESWFPAGRSLDTQPQPDRRPWQDRSPSRSRRESLESLGARMSRLSLSRGVPWAAPSAQPALGCRDPPRGHLVAAALPGHSWRAPGISAGRSRAGTSTGSSLPRASSARTRGHPSLGIRRQEPPGNVTLAVDREGGGRRRAGPAVGAPGQWGSPVSQKRGLPCKGVAGQPVPPGWGSQEGTPELGAGAKPWSQGDRARTGLALLGHPRDGHQRCHTGLQSTPWQGACVGQEWRRTGSSLEEKLELLERLRALLRLRAMLRRDTAETLRQLRDAREQDGPGSARREHLRSLGTPPWGRGPRPSRALAPGPPPAALGWAPGGDRGDTGVPLVPPLPRACAPRSPLLVLRGLRQRVQRRLGQWQRLQRALGAAGLRHEEGQRGQQPGKGSAPGAPREPPARLGILEKIPS